MSRVNQRSNNALSPSQTQIENQPSLNKASDKVEAGNKSQDYYKLRLSPLRYKLRSFCLPYVTLEQDSLLNIQSSLRNPYLDFYFAWTANLASHTFYVLMLPLPLWFGFDSISRDLVHILGFGIFFTGTAKDYLCLPRPHSPPLHRITMSGYTSKEYGWPSSHSANATSVTLFLAIQATKNLHGSKLFSTLILLSIYYFSLIFGRIYCGMHGFFDILSGSTIGLLVVLLRYTLGEIIDHYLLNAGPFTPLLIIAFYLSLIHFHSQPADDCPCFDDSVAFIGVLIGLDISHWGLVYTKFLKSDLRPILIPFSYLQTGLLKASLRTILGITLVVLWKSISKPFFFKILPPIYKKIGIYIPRNFYKSAADKNSSNSAILESSNNIDERVANVQSFIKSIVEHRPHDERTSETEPMENCGALKSRYDVEVIARLFIYAGVAITAVWGFLIVIELVSLTCI